MNDPSVSITVNPINLLTTIKYNNLNFRSVNQLNLSLSSIDESIEIKNDGALLPWYLFIQGISNFIYILKLNNIGISFDKFSKGLLTNYLDDKKSFTSKSQITQDTQNLTSLLINLNFRRKLTKEQYRDLEKLLSLKHGANFSVGNSGDIAHPFRSIAHGQERENTGRNYCTSGVRYSPESSQFSLGIS